MSLKFCGPVDCPTSLAIEAIGYAEDKGARISNNSYGGPGYSQAFEEAIDASSMLFVAAAGNGGADGVGDDNDASPSYPASYDIPNVLSVAAINNGGGMPTFSNYGATSVDVSAPGVGILSTVPGNAYAYYNGTSMATPHATGVAALAASANLALLDDPAGLKKTVMDNAKAAPSTAGKTVTGKMVDANAAVVAVGEEPPGDEEPVEPERGCTIRGTDGDDTLEGTPAGTSSADAGATTRSTAARATT